ncbi:iron chelate uptake ABC transporter family permease subunit [Patulibacter sp.]|uniref:iron chelate uptake ABC transporter family permease subunit n=1 Tax=Patulibacter sp. TaxID=1912859 RepID=UPI002718C938|nr:iron chelate uptake ABC transporter family permease subunit [Patulibacter sp.]MDO9410367.1 iron chelate uptake ABC transporter family permease subunit [Patulibacter sp.]
MSVTVPQGASATAPQTPAVRARRGSLLALGLVAAFVVLLVMVALSVSVGSRTIALDRVWGLVFSPDGSDDAVVVRDLRIPRTLLGLLVGAALGLAGALMQALTRNPLADPGILGVNAGAAAMVVAGIALFGYVEPTVQVWFAFLGAGLATVIVYGVASRGSSGATPVRLALAGIALTFALYAVVQGITTLKPQVFNQYRFWQVGSLAGHDASVTRQVAPFIGAGIVLALLLARPLNTLALGDDLSRSLGANIARTRALGALSITLLCGAATAAAGPIAFIGLTVPHVARAIAGPDQRWVLPYSMVLAPTLLLFADVIGRIVTRPGELQVSIVTAVIGAPVFIAIVRRRRIAQL